jgi:hypothetical protein
VDVYTFDERVGQALADSLSALVTMLGALPTEFDACPVDERTPIDRVKKNVPADKFKENGSCADGALNTGACADALAFACWNNPVFTSRIVLRLQKLSF